MTNNELKNSVKELFSMLKRYSDKPEVAYELNVYLRHLLRMNGNVNSLPITEIMTIIRYDKPIAFSELRKMSNKNLMLDILTGLSTDIDTAKTKLTKLMNE